MDSLLQRSPSHGYLPTDPILSSMIGRLIDYLHSNPKQKVLSVLGLSHALELKNSDRPTLITAAFILTSQTYNLLTVRYKLFDINLRHDSEDLSAESYRQAAIDGYYIEEDGHEIPYDEFINRAFPYFIRRTPILVKDKSNY